MYPLNSWTGNAEFRINLTTNEGNEANTRLKYLCNKFGTKNP